MSFSLIQSYEKFSQLREKLRRITGHEPEQSNNKHLRKPLEKVREINELEISTGKFKESKPARTVQTQRKKKLQWNQHEESSFLGKEKDSDRHLLRMKEQALNEINRLLDLKKEYLNEIQSQLNKQSKKEIKARANHASKFDETLKFSSAKVKVPDLYQIRDERRKLRERGVAGKYL